MPNHRFTVVSVYIFLYNMFSPIPGIKRGGEVLLRGPNTLPGFKLPHQKQGPEAKHPIEKRVDEWWKNRGDTDTDILGEM